MGENPVVMWELASHDQERTVAFLRKVFNWDLTLDEGLGFYLMPATEKERSEFGGGSVFTLGKAKLPFLTLFIRVEDIEAKAALVEQAGGHVIEAPNSIPGGSKISLFNEPLGVTLAMIEPAAKQPQEQEEPDEAG